MSITLNITNGKSMDNEWLRKRRIELDMTQEDVSEILSHALGRKILTTSVHHWENGRSRVTMLNTPEEAAVLARTLHWSVAQLLSAAGFDINVATVGEIDVPENVYEMVKLVSVASHEKRELILQLITLLYNQIPDGRLASEYKIPEHPNLEGRD